MQLRKTTKLDTLASKSLAKQEEQLQIKKRQERRRKVRQSVLHTPMSNVVIAQGQGVVTIAATPADEWSFKPDEKTNGTGKVEIIDCIKTETVIFF